MFIINNTVSDNTSIPFNVIDCCSSDLTRKYADGEITAEELQSSRFKPCNKYEYEESYDEMIRSIARKKEMENVQSDHSSCQSDYSSSQIDYSSQSYYSSRQSGSGYRSRTRTGYRSKFDKKKSSNPFFRK